MGCDGRAVLVGGRYRVASVNADARTVTRSPDLKEGKPVQLPRISRANITGVSFARSENLLAFYVGGDTSPQDLYVLDLRDGKHRGYHQPQPKIKQEDLVASEVVRYPSFDKLEIPSVAIQAPRRLRGQVRFPALVWVHGGPGGQSRVGYDPTIQFLATTATPSCGQQPRQLRLRQPSSTWTTRKRRGRFEGRGSSRRYLEGLRLGRRQASRHLAASYGGYMVCAALAFEPDASTAAIDIFGVTNWVRTLESIPPWWAVPRSLYAELGDPKTDGERLTAHLAAVQPRHQKAAACHPGRQRSARLKSRAMRWSKPSRTRRAGRVHHLPRRGRADRWRPG